MRKFYEGTEETMMATTLEDCLVAENLGRLAVINDGRILGFEDEFDREYPKKIVLTGAHCGIQQLYDRIAMSLSLSTAASYDCRKILVSPQIQVDVFDYYEKQGMEDYESAMFWICYGPKVDESLKDYEVILQEDWYEEDM